MTDEKNPQELLVTTFKLLATTLDFLSQNYLLPTSL